MKLEGIASQSVPGPISMESTLVLRIFDNIELNLLPEAFLVGRDPLIAHLYGLAESEFTHILSTFPLVSNETKSATLAAFRIDNLR